MKSNLIKYLFFIFVIGIMIFSIYKINGNKEETVVQDSADKLEQNEVTKEINLGIAEYDTINPILSNNKYVQEVSRLIYDSLLIVDENYKIKESLAKEWAKTSEITYILKLREDVKWSNGNEFTANDVRYTIDRLKDTPSIYGSNVQNIINVLTIDKYTVQITLNQEIPFFEYNLTFPIMSSLYYEGENFSTSGKNNMPIGTGKFCITENNDTSIILKKNENYYGNKQILEKITINKYVNIAEFYNAFKLGKIDLVTTNNIDLEKYIGTIGYNIKKIPSKEYTFLTINTQNAVLSNLEVRKAISHAINKDNIVNSLFNGKYNVSNYPLEYGNWLQKENIQTEYNPSKAKQILEENEWTFNYNKWQKTVNYRYMSINFKLLVKLSNQTQIAIAEMIKENLEDIGIKITIVKANDWQYNSYLEQKNYDMVLCDANLSFSPNLNTFLGIDNMANFENEEIFQIMNEVKNITDEELLKQKYKRLYEIYNEQLPYIGLYNGYYAVATSVSIAGTVNANWLDIYSNIDNWYKN